MKNKFDITLLDLEDWQTRTKYSQKLKDFEDQFTYPLGDKSFHLRHGFGGNYDYFSFFEQMGDVYYMVIEHNGQLIGAGCAVLRTIESKKVWYLCDFKVDKAHRGRRILEKMFRRYLISFYLKSNKMFFVNMSGTKDNGLVNKASRIFKIFGLKKQDLYFFEWNNQTIHSADIDLEKFVIVTNKHKKDVVIEDSIYNIHHLVPKDSYVDFDKFQEEKLGNIGKSDIIMYSSTLNDTVTRLLSHDQPTTIGSFVSHRFNTDVFSSAEI